MIDQHHAALVEIVFSKKIIIRLHHNINERVADTEEVEIGHIRILYAFWNAGEYSERPLTSNHKRNDMLEEVLNRVATERRAVNSC